MQALNRYKNTQLRRAIIANADSDLSCALAECVYNIVKKNIPLTDAQRQQFRKYRNKLRELSQRRAPAARRRRILLQQQVGEGQSGASYFFYHLTNLSRSSCKLCLSVSLVTFLNTFVSSTNFSTLLDMSSSKLF